VLERMYSNPAAVEHAVDHLGLARAAMDAGRDAAVDHHLARAGDLTNGHERRDALHMAARHAARNRLFDQARDLWEQIVEIDSADDPAHLALAKHFEHREKNYDRALVHARMTVEIEGDEGNAHRMARIERKKKKDE
jgi:lipopolysaccharide biosynthesis regulator YciM